MRPDGGERHLRRDELILAVELEILFRPHGIRVGMLWLRLDTLGHIGEDLAGAEHTVGIQAIVAGRLVSARV